VVGGALFFVLVLSAAVLVIVLEICDMAACGEFQGIVPSSGFRVPRMEFKFQSDCGMGIARYASTWCREPKIELPDRGLNGLDELSAKFHIQFVREKP